MGTVPWRPTLHSTAGPRIIGERGPEVFVPRPNYGAVSSTAGPEFFRPERIRPNPGPCQGCGATMMDHSVRWPRCAYCGSDR